jgi:hypothetical protein
MANEYRVEMVVRGSKKDLDELESILQAEVDADQTREDYYTFHKSIVAMGFDPNTVEHHRAYVESIGRNDDGSLWVHYCGAWSYQPGVLRCIHKRWPELTLEWSGVDEFGQDPRSNMKELEGRYQLEDLDAGLNPFCLLDDWVGEEAVPCINKYYGTDVKTVEEALDTIDGLCGTMVMEYVDDDEVYTEEEMNKIH